MTGKRQASPERKEAGPSRWLGHPSDLVGIFERLLRTDDEDEEFVKVPVALAWAILDLAKRAPATRRGRPDLSSRDKLRRGMTIRRARLRKQELIDAAKAEGRVLSANDAAWIAAEECASKWLSANTIRDRMDRKKPRP
jgi:hypothetical protein